MKLGISKAEHERVALAQRASLQSIAKKIERGEALNSLEAAFSAAALRHMAQQIPTKPPRRRGQEPQLDPGNLAIEFALLVHTQGHTPNAAHEALAERYSVSVQAIKKALSKYGLEALSLIPRTRVSRNQKKK
jgi:hypothetical protein